MLKLFNSVISENGGVINANITQIADSNTTFIVRTVTHSYSRLAPFLKALRICSRFFCRLAVLNS
jgi:hypothetical protein